MEHASAIKILLLLANAACTLVRKPESYTYFFVWNWPEKFNAEAHCTLFWQHLHMGKKGVEHNTNKAKAKKKRESKAKNKDLCTKLLKGKRRVTCSGSKYRTAAIKLLFDNRCMCRPFLASVLTLLLLSFDTNWAACFDAPLLEMPLIWNSAQKPKVAHIKCANLGNEMDGLLLTQLHTRNFHFTKNEIPCSSW